MTANADPIRTPRGATRSLRYLAGGIVLASVLLFIVATYSWVFSNWYADTVMVSNITLEHNIPINHATLVIATKSREVSFYYITGGHVAPSRSAKSSNFSIPVQVSWASHPAESYDAPSQGTRGPTTLLGQLGFGWGNDVARPNIRVHGQTAAIEIPLIALMLLFAVGPAWWIIGRRSPEDQPGNAG